MTKNFNSIHEDTELIFVYGSLKRGFHNESLLYNAKSLGKVKTVKKYPLIVTKNLHYPYLVKEEGKGYEIIGELYRVKKNELEKLDQFEGKEFKREKIRINRNFLKRKTIRWLIQNILMPYKMVWNGFLSVALPVVLVLTVW